MLSSSTLNVVTTTPACGVRPPVSTDEAVPEIVMLAVGGASACLGLLLLPQATRAPQVKAASSPDDGFRMRRDYRGWGGLVSGRGRGRSPDRAHGHARGQR